MLFAHQIGRRIAFLLFKAVGKSTPGLGYALAFADTVLAPATPSNSARGGCQVTSAIFLTGVAPNSLMRKLAKDNFHANIT